MKVLLTGATGFIGQAVAEALLAEGHHLVCTVRDPARLRLRRKASMPVPAQVQALALDFSHALQPADWRAALEGVDAVVNTVGIFEEKPERHGRLGLIAKCSSLSWLK